MATMPPMMAMSSWMMSSGFKKIFLSGNTISASAMGISSKRFMLMLRRSSACTGQEPFPGLISSSSGISSEVCVYWETRRADGMSTR